MSGTQDGQGTVQACLDRNTWEEAGFDLSLNGVQSTILHLDSVEDVHHITLAGIMGQDEASFVTTEASAGRDSSTTLSWRWGRRTGFIAAMWALGSTSTCMIRACAMIPATSAW